VTPNKPIKWAATLAQVREVSLIGGANLAFWSDRLKAQGLLLREINGKAQIMILGAAAKFAGLKFREISISIQAARSGGQSRQEEVFLLSAFNSNRFFAFCERFFFSTPYHHAKVDLDSAPASLRIAGKSSIAFLAHMSGNTTPNPSQQSDEQWQGAVHLPNMKRGSNTERFFFARLAGHTQRYPFLPSADSLTINPLASGDVLSALIESRFTPTEWIVRPDATHAKSKTYQRDAPPLS